MKKVLFWDFDGTLVYPDAKWSNALHTALNKMNYPISLEEVVQHLRTGYTWHTPEISYTQDIGQKWWDNLFHHLNGLYQSHAVSAADANRANSSLKKQILDAKNYRMYADTQMTLGQCKKQGYENYILSNNFPELPLVIEGLGLSDYFVDYVVSANLGYEKPHQEIFCKALSLIESPDICYMIGDNPVADIQGGKAAGMKTILVHKDGDFDTNYHCKELSEIPVLLAKQPL